MNKQQARTVHVLNQLFAAERRSLLPRLAETGAFVSSASAAEAATLQRMVREEREHLQWLAEAMDRCCGVIYPAGADVHTGHLHYLELHTLLPQAVKSCESLVRAYQEAGKQALAEPAREVINRILARRQAHLQELRTLQGHAAAAPGA